MKNKIVPEKLTDAQIIYWSSLAPLCLSLLFCAYLREKNNRPAFVQKSHSCHLFLDRNTFLLGQTLFCDFDLLEAPLTNLFPHL
jgi:hypothetical protein